VRGIEPRFRQLHPSPASPAVATAAERPEGHSPAAPQPETLPLSTPSDLSPIKLAELELAAPLPSLSLADARSGRRYTRALVLVRLHGRPLGLMELSTAEESVTAAQAARLIWQALRHKIVEHLLDDGLPPPGELTEHGLPDPARPRCRAEREQVLASAPLVSVIVPTRDRPDRLAECLRSLCAVAYPRYEIIVVDNAPTTEATAMLVRDQFGHLPQVRYVREALPGPARARNRGLAVARGEIAAFIDDDAICDPHWLTELVRGFAAGHDVACVTGCILPRELETPAQIWFEQFGGLNKGFSRRIFDLAAHRPPDPLYPFTAGQFGSGPNMAFRTERLRALGGFPVVLCPGNLAIGGEDLFVFFQLIVQGHQIVYEPGALVYHLHRREYAALKRQVFVYGSGLCAFLLHVMATRPGLVPALLPLVPGGLRYLLSRRSPKNCKKSAAYPSELTREELKGVVYGPLAYLISRQRSRREPEHSGATAAVLRDLDIGRRRSRHEPEQRGGGQERSAPGRSRWGRLPLLAAIVAIGLLLAAAGMAGARAGARWADPAFWSALLLMVAPVAWRLGSMEASRDERLGLVAMLGVGLYLVKVWHSPLYFTFYDELQHTRTVADIARTGHLFTANPILPVSPLYPGLESVTTALAGLGRLTTFSAGLVVAGAARLVLLLALFLLYEEASGSARIGGIAALLYMANPNFLFFDAQFAYETLALPLATSALLAIAWRRRAGPHHQHVALTAVALLALAALTITHHLSSFALAAFLFLWAAVARALARWPAAEQPESASIRGMALLAVVLSLSWMIYVASLTPAYLSSILSGGLEDLMRLLSGQGAGRQLFRDATGQVLPLWERATAYVSTALLLLGLPAGLIELWRRRRATTLALALGAGSLAYPASLALRLTARGLEVANRTSEFVFVPLAYTLALAATGGWLERLAGWERRLAGTAAMAILFAGGVILGWPAYARLPGPYVPAAPVRSVEPQAIAAAEWAGRSLQPGSRVATDVTNQLIAGAYGPVQIETNANYVPLVFFAPELGPAERRIMANWRIDYLLVDLRLSTGLPAIGHYFGLWEPGAPQHARPIDRAVLAKFDGLPGISRVFDSGAIAIYDVGAVAGGS